MDLSRFEPQVQALAQALRQRGWRMASAESCTGGLIAAACTAVAGSSDWFERGFVSYSNEAKTEMLAVPAQVIAEHGAVSEAVARAMAVGAIQRSRAQLSVAVTGIAGPGGATPGKPVGTVWLAVAVAVADAGESADAGLRITALCLQLDGDRTAVREQTVWRALQQLQASAG